MAGLKLNRVSAPGRCGLQDHQQHQQHAEHRQGVEEQERNEVADLGLEVVDVELAAGPRKVLDVLLGDAGQGGHPDEPEPGEHDTAGGHPATEHHRGQLREHADGRNREQERDGLGDDPAGPHEDAFVAAETGAGVAVVEEEVGQGADEHRHHEDDAEREHERRPRERRDAPHGHPGGPGGEQCRGHRTGGGGEPDGHQPHPGDEEVDGVGVAAERSPVVDQGDRGEDHATEPHPEAAGGKAGEGDRAGPELQRHGVDARCHHQRQQGGEDEADVLSVDELRQHLDVEGDIGAVEALDCDQHVDRNGRDQAEESAGEVQPSGDLVVGGREHGRDSSESAGVVDVAVARGDRFGTRFDGGHTGWCLTCLWPPVGSGRLETWQGTTAPRLLGRSPCARNPRESVSGRSVVTSRCGRGRRRSSHRTAR